MSDADATRTGLHAQADFPPGTVLAGRFQVESVLGIGGMGVVYRAQDLSLGVTVALKLLRPELAHRRDVFERFRQELLLARQVSNPHVVRIHDLAQHEGRWLISMDYVDGETLDRRIDRDGPLPVEDAAAIARQVAEGLAAAHAKDVVHRDLKPANVLLDRDGNAYISDFGVARSLATSGATEGLTRGGAVVGTPHYLSPEQARGDAVDARSDLYALGLILYEMLAGKLPFAGGTVAEILAQRMVRTPEPLARARADAPPWLQRLVDRLLRPQPAHRLQSAREVVAAIDGRALARSFHFDTFRQRHGAWLALAAVLALALGAAGWWQWRARAPAVEAVAVSQPLDRMLVLPLSGSGDEALDAALGAHLQASLAAVPGFAVVDGERGLQALRQLDPSGDARPQPDALRSAAAARRVLRPELVEQGGRWTLRAVLHGEAGDRQRIDGPSSGDAAGAVAAWLASSATARSLGFDAAPATGAPSPQALAQYGAGLLAERAGRLDQALQGYTAATARAPGYAPAWLAQSRTALAIGDQEQALGAAVRGQNAAANAPRAWQRRLAAQRASLEGDASAAAAHWRAVVQATPEDTLAELELARALGAGGDFDAAVQALQALTVRDAGDPRAWFELGKFSILQGNARVAVDDYLTRALVAFKRSRDRYGEAEAVNALGVGYGRLGQTADAAEQYRKAVELRRALGNRAGVATSLRNLANVLSLTGDFAGAGEALQQARALNIELGDSAGNAAVDNELGLLAEERGDFPAALEAFRRALQAWQQLDDAHGAAEALNNIGFASFQLGRYGDAQVYWQQAADAYETLGEQSGRVRTTQNLGLLATARGRWGEARRLLQQSLSLSEQQQMLEEAAVSRRNLAELELMQGRLQAALEQAAKAEAAFRRRQDLRGSSDAALLRVEALLAARAHAQAQEALDALREDLASASGEQRAIARLLAAELAAARGDARVADAALRDAHGLAEASGIRQLQLRIGLAEASRVPARLAALDEPTVALGHAGLRLEWLRQRMRQALAGGDAAAAVAAYREAAVLLRAGDALQAHALHRLGARARAADGDAAGARSAELRAEEALATLQSGLPQPLRAAFDGALAASAEQAP